MSKNRIQINGEWYVKENASVEPLISKEDLSYSVECCWDGIDWTFKAFLMLEGDETDIDSRYSDIFIKIIDKRDSNRDNWLEEGIDNPRWILGVLENNPDSMVDATAMFDSEGLSYFKAFANCLVERGWLKK